MNTALLSRLIKSSPILYMPYLRLTREHYRRKVCNRESDLVIEGYESSGNSFLFATFQYLHPELSIGHHVHKVAHLKLARRFDVRSVIVFREPAQAVASRIAGFGCDPDLGVLEYIDFYRFVLRHRSDFSVYEFDDVVGRIDRVVNSIERTHGFAVSDIDKADLERKVREVMDRKAVANRVASRLPVGSRSLKREEIAPGIRDHRRWPDLAAVHDELAGIKIRVS